MLLTWPEKTAWWEKEEAIPSLNEIWDGLDSLLFTNAIDRLRLSMYKLFD